MATITLKGEPIHTSGELPAVGARAPDFLLVDRYLDDVRLGSFAGKKKLISIVPSLDTGVCAASTKKFAELLAGRDDVVVLIVSCDLPFAQARFCEAGGVEGIETLSLMRSRDFARDYGVLITDGPLAGITARAVVVLDGNDVVRYTEQVPEITTEPDYDRAIAAL